MLTRIFITVIAFALAPLGSLYAQYWPEDGCVLNYRLIRFSVPELHKSGAVSVQLAEGNYKTEKEFEAAGYQNFEALKDNITALAPHFGREYTWRVMNRKVPGQLYHFRIGSCKFVDDSLFRMAIRKTTERYAGCYFMADVTRVIYSVDGTPVWYLPDIPGEIDSNTVVRDLELTKSGTLTFLAGNSGYEVNYEGKLLWKTPKRPIENGDSIERFHHDLNKLSNGHYMAMGNMAMTWDWKRNRPGDSSIVLHSPGYKYPQPVNNRPATIPFATLLEMDARGKVVWMWNSLDYFKTLPSTEWNMHMMDTHANAFYLDEENRVIYVSVKNTNQIIKLSYPDGKIIKVYGGYEDPNGLLPFCEQHSCKINRDGNIYIFNNNMCSTEEGPNVLVYRENANNATLEKVWEYNFTPGKFNLRRPRPRVTSGGCATELFDGALYVSLCVPDGNMYIINEQKTIEWEACLERCNLVDKKWITFPTYRSSFVSDNGLFQKLLKGTRK